MLKNLLRDILDLAESPDYNSHPKQQPGDLKLFLYFFIFIIYFYIEFFLELYNIIVF